MGDRPPFLEPQEAPYQTWQILLGIAVLVFGAAGAIAYMLCKLPRAGDLSRKEQPSEQDGDKPEKP